jgi:prepilin-type N-terminal cleavage/methylation domain-containing protein
MKSLRTSQRSTSRRGFSLVEVLAAMTIFSVAIVAVLQGLGNSAAFQSQILFEQKASVLAQNILEEMIYSGNWAEGSMSGDFGAGSVEISHFAWTTYVDGTGIDYLWQATVEIVWDDGGIEREFRLVTLFSEPAPAGEEPPPA